jgi:hypothetical protein
MHKQFLLKILYSRAPVSTDSATAVSVIRGLSRPEKNLKMKEINGSSASKRAQARTGRNMLKSNSPNAPST